MPATHDPDGPPSPKRPRVRREAALRAPTSYAEGVVDDASDDEEEEEQANVFWWVPIELQALGPFANFFFPPYDGTLEPLDTQKEGEANKAGEMLFGGGDAAEKDEGAGGAAAREKLAAGDTGKGKKRAREEEVWEERCEEDEACVEARRERELWEKDHSGLESDIVSWAIHSFCGATIADMHGFLKISGEVNLPGFFEEKITKHEETDAMRDVAAHRAKHSKDSGWKP